MGQLPSVSVVIPTRDRPELLDRALEGVFNQQYDGWMECLVVFDRSEPTTPGVPVPDHVDLKLLENTREPGLAGTRNTGILAARGDLVAFCDDDDQWLPDKTAKQVAALSDHPDAPLATAGINVRYGDRVIPRLPGSDTVTFDDLLRSRRMEVHSSTLLFRREALLDQIGLVDEDLPGAYGEDYDLLLRAANVAPLASVDEPLVDVYWQTSYFSDRWPMIIEALNYMLDKHPELKRYPKNLSRMYGRLAFAYAATGQSDEAKEWSRRSRKLDWRQPRPYLAAMVAHGLVKPKTVAKLVNRAGKGL